MLRSMNVLGLLALAAALGGCSTTEDSQARMFANPGQFELFDCPRLAMRAQELAKREQELRMLTAKAGDDAAGRFIAGQAYHSEYMQVRGQLGEIARMQAIKNCDATNARPRQQRVLPAPPRKDQRS
ncbi:MAG TPA: hypothetical protein VFB45_21050 [Pseudolabrys sp.]|nr:hypothetical protein [Pseudolabrys sp.]